MESPDILMNSGLPVVTAFSTGFTDRNKPLPFSNKYNGYRFYQPGYR